MGIKTHQILARYSAGISELKKNPMAVIEQGRGEPVAILNRNEPVFYAIPAENFESLMGILKKKKESRSDFFFGETTVSEDFTVSGMKLADANLIGRMHNKQFFTRQLNRMLGKCANNEFNLIAETTEELDELLSVIDLNEIGIVEIKQEEEADQYMKYMDEESRLYQLHCELVLDQGRVRITASHWYGTRGSTQEELISRHFTALIAHGLTSRTVLFKGNDCVDGFSRKGPMSIKEKNGPN